MIYIMNRARLLAAHQRTIDEVDVASSYTADFLVTS